MRQRFWLSLLVTSAIVASPLMADPLPEAKKPGFRGCRTGLISDSKALADESNIAQALWCVEKMATDPDFKAKNSNFKKELGTGKLKEALEASYADDKNALEAVLAQIASASGTASIKEELAARKDKANQNKIIKSAKSDLKNVDKNALENMLAKIENSSDKLIEISGITQTPAKRASYGSRTLTKEAKAPFGPIFFREAKANEYKIENLGFMKAAVEKLMKNPKDIPGNPKFIQAAAKAMTNFWATKACFGTLDEAGFNMVKELVRNTSILAGALKSYQEDVSGAKDSINTTLQSAQRTKADAKQTIKGGEKYTDGEDYADGDADEKKNSESDE